MKSEPTLTLDELEAALFPCAVLPVSADTIAAYAHYTARFTALTFAADAIALHARSLASHPELAGCLRSPEAVADVAGASEVLAARTGREPHAYAAEQVEVYKRALARHLAEASGHELQRAARSYLASCDARDRADAERRAAEERELAERRAAEERELAERKAEAERRAAEVEAARQRAESASAIAEATQRAYLDSRRRRFIAELQAAGVKTLRIRSAAAGVARGSYAVDVLLAQAPMLGLEQLAIFERALSDVLEAAEDAELAR